MAVVGVPGSDAGVDAGAGAIEKVAAASMGMGGVCVMIIGASLLMCQTPP